MRRLLLGIAIVAGCTGAAHAKPAELHIVDLAQGTDALQVEICRAERGVCSQHKVVRGSVLRMPRVSPGRYTFTVSDTAGELEHFTYGMGRDAAYSLALYGIAAHPAELGWWAWLKKWLGGAEERQVSGYAFHHRMISLDPEKQNGPGELRLVDYAPGAAGLSGHLDWKTGGEKIPATRWDSASKAVPALRPSAWLTVMLGGATTPAAQCELTLPRGSKVLVYAAAIEGAHAWLVPDFVAADHATAACGSSGRQPRRKAERNRYERANFD